MQVAPGVYRFERSIWNWFVLEDEGRLTVIDAGFPRSWNALVHGIDSIGRKLGDIEAVVITHAHADHTGFAERLRQTLGIPVFTHHDDAERASSTAFSHRIAPAQGILPPMGFVWNLYRPYVAKLLWHAYTEGAPISRPIKKLTTFEHGEVLPVPGRPTVLHMPGHTVGQVALHVPDRGVLFTSDSMITMNLLTGSPSPPALCYHGVNDDDESALASLPRLKGLGEVTILPGHGDPWLGDSDDAVHWAVQNRSLDCRSSLAAST
jgi:glyoxylase-like metal-dependent hydrolase (beta-lactamase superfamily II)